MDWVTIISYFLGACILLVGWQRTIDAARSITTELKRLNDNIDIYLKTRKP